MKAKAKKSAVTPPPGGEVDAFMASLEHPLKAEIAAARQIIVGAAPGIAEGIKWNAPSFRTTEFFATTHLRSRASLQFVFHLGAKKRAAQPELKIADSAGLLKWLAKDRALVTLGAGTEFAARRTALRDLVRAWITYV